MTPAHKKLEIRRKEIRAMCAQVVSGKKKQSWLRSHLRSDGEVKFSTQVVSTLWRRKGY